ncbi:BON domain-containing protein [Dyadobacter frigoris]|uniref:BON domain-containing protein n=1 Tax=Dyadobacter frigoris TaxID=2576211 RepID=A0A4U6D2L0_9BACT|nr:BON domain-containing protein [Dyadobacter frigoris]TKT90397.1 BON domain-containing protein [Dyadobacter frigoris]GLU57241.1 hypothetical protein Dfri01_67020 [Dyadobacter frigoris]
MKNIQKPEEPKYDPEAARFETDKNLREKVMAALQANSLINASAIRVRVTDRIVFLEGMVHRQKERIAAKQCIKDIFGIRSVINYLTYHTDYTE